MNTPRLSSIACALAVAGLATLAACGAGDDPKSAAAAPAAPPAAATRPAPAPAPVARADHGRITAIAPVSQAPKPSGAGAVLGGVVGAALGNQVGKGNGRAAATVVGGVGGAVAGHEIEKRRADPVVVGYKVTVQMEDGSTRQLQPEKVGDLRVGDRVRLDGGGVIQRV